MAPTFVVFGWVSLVMLYGGRTRADLERPGCVMRGPCSDDTGYGSKNCHVVEDPRPLEDEDALKILRDVCPDLVAGHETSGVCCSKGQLEELETNMALPANLGFRKCPACLSNFRKIFCHFTCSPRQSHFVRVTSVGPKPEDDSGKEEVVEEVEYHMSRDFADAMFASCQGVKSALGSRPLDLMCGSLGADCTVEGWLEFMGSDMDHGGFAPFQINFRLTEEKEVQVEGDTYHPMAADVTRCSQAPPEGGKPCQCEDCEEACPAASE